MTLRSACRRVRTKYALGGGSLFAVEGDSGSVGALYRGERRRMTAVGTRLCQAITFHGFVELLATSRRTAVVNMDVEGEVGARHRASPRCDVGLGLARADLSPL